MQEVVVSPIDLRTRWARGLVMAASVAVWHLTGPSDVSAAQAQGGGAFQIQEDRALGGGGMEIENESRAEGSSGMKMDDGSKAQGSDGFKMDSKGGGAKGNEGFAADSEDPDSGAQGNRGFGAEEEGAAEGSSGFSMEDDVAEEEDAGEGLGWLGPAIAGAFALIIILVAFALRASKK